MAKKKQKIEECRCEDNYLIITSYWMSMREWCGFHNRTEGDYYSYRASAAKKPREFFGVFSSYVNQKIRHRCY
jgi:hypothetical protein